VCTREQVLDSVFGLAQILVQHIRYRVSIAARRLHEQGADRASMIVHRCIGRAFQRVDELERCSVDAFRRRVRVHWQQWQALDARLRRMDLRLRLSEAHRRHQALSQHLKVRIEALLQTRRGQVDSLSVQLTQLSPLKVLDRGYAIVQDASGHVVKGPEEVASGSEITALLAKGILRAEVK
jgi:exodeoxyribonuclease VII large subunit